MPHRVRCVKRLSDANFQVIDLRLKLRLSHRSSLAISARHFLSRFQFFAVMPSRISRVGTFPDFMLLSANIVGIALKMAHPEIFTRRREVVPHHDLDRAVAGDTPDHFKGIAGGEREGDPSDAEAVEAAGRNPTPTVGGVLECRGARPDSGPCHGPPERRGLLRVH